MGLSVDLKDFGLPLVTAVDGIPVAFSTSVANRFDKSHSKVLRDIRSLIAQCDQEFNEANFGLVEYTDSKGERRPSYWMSRDGFTLLAMGFTGKKALQFKLLYIKSFNQMEASLQRGEKNLWQKLQTLIAKETESQVKASFGSHLMLERKREKPYLETERFLLESEIQPSLLN